MRAKEEREKETEQQKKDKVEPELCKHEGEEGLKDPGHVMHRSKFPMMSVIILRVQIEPVN